MSDTKGKYDTFKQQLSKKIHETEVIGTALEQLFWKSWKFVNLQGEPEAKPPALQNRPGSFLRFSMVAFL